MNELEIRSEDPTNQQRHFGFEHCSAAYLDDWRMVGWGCLLGWLVGWMMVDSGQ
jgi:hypothetical protein